MGKLYLCWYIRQNFGENWRFGNLACLWWFLIVLFGFWLFCVSRAEDLLFCILDFVWFVLAF